MQEAPAELTSPVVTSRPSLRGHLLIARADHWIKSVFVLPGIVVAASIDRSVLNSVLARNILIGLLAVCLISSSNYVLNEILDAPYDHVHPTKRSRPVPSGQVNIRLAYLQWIVLMIAGTGLSLLVSLPFTATMLGLWIMGCVYNISPVRTKDIPFLDVLSEAVNNPLSSGNGDLSIAGVQERQRRTAAGEAVPRAQTDGRDRRVRIADGSVAVRRCAHPATDFCSQYTLIPSPSGMLKCREMLGPV
jgi:hypothetical protein